MRNEVPREGAELAGYIRGAGLTRKRVCAEADLDESYLCRFINGRQPMPPLTLVEIGRAIERAVAKGGQPCK